MLRRLGVMIVLTLSLGLVSAAMAQDRRPVVAIGQIEDLTGNSLSPQLSTMIQTAVVGTGKFRIMERANIDQLVAEQGRARTGMVTSNRPARTGGFEGVDFIIYGTITSLINRSESNMGASILSSMLTGSQGAGCESAVATLELDIRITNAETGEIRYVDRISEVARSQTNCTGGQASVDSGVLLRAASDKIATGLVTTIYPILVAGVQGDGTVILNYGDGTVTVGQVLNVFARGEEIRDPATGEVIGSTEAKLGMIRISEVTGRISRAQPVSPFAVPPAVGSVARPASEEEVRALSARPRRR
jgi:hypothetical protein